MMTIEAMEQAKQKRMSNKENTAKRRAAEKRLFLAQQGDGVKALGLAMLDLEAKLERFASGNIASTPIAMMLEDGQWTVDVTVHIPRVTEYAIDATNTDLAVAIAECAANLSNQGILTRSAKQDAKVFGYEI